MSILLDLHGGPGSQNGFDNSGRRGEVHWHEGDNANRTIAILDKITAVLESWIADGTMTHETIWGIELLNEPGGWNQALWQITRDFFNLKGYDMLRSKHFQQHQEKPWVAINQAFRPYQDFVNYMSENDGYSKVMLDMHTYHCFGPEYNSMALLPEGWALHLVDSCAQRNFVDANTLPSVLGSHLP